jgi:hypothetical protein
LPLVANSSCSALVHLFSCPPNEKGTSEGATLDPQPEPQSLNLLHRDCCCQLSQLPCEES